MILRRALLLLHLLVHWCRVCCIILLLGIIFCWCIDCAGWKLRLSLIYCVRWSNYIIYNVWWEYIIRIYSWLLSCVVLLLNSRLRNRFVRCISWLHIRFYWWYYNWFYNWDNCWSNDRYNRYFFWLICWCLRNWIYNRLYLWNNNFRGLDRLDNRNLSRCWLRSGLNYSICGCWNRILNWLSNTWILINCANRPYK